LASANSKKACTGAAKKHLIDKCLRYIQK